MGLFGAALIVQEAGGRVTDFCGNGHFMDGHHIIATNGYLHSVYQQLIAEVPPWISDDIVAFNSL